MRFLRQNSISIINAMIGFTLLLCICSSVVATHSPQQKPERIVPQCGHWAILRCCQILGVPMNMQDLLMLLPPQKQGHSMYAVSRILKKIGLHAEGRRETFVKLMDASFPVIAHMKPEHFVVVIHADENYVFLFDGNGRRKVWLTKEFEKHWTHNTLRVWRNLQDSPFPTFLPRRIDTAPCIQFETLLVDKGEIPAVGEGVEFVFPFCNLGQADLVIKKIRTNCGCMESTKPTEPIAPGRRSQITLKYNVNKGSGSFSHEALVQTNDPVVPLIKLTASGNTSKAVRVQPKFLDLGRLVCRKASVINCHVQYTGDNPLDILKVECPNPQLSVEWRVLSKELAQQYVPAMPKTVKSFRRNMRTLEIRFTPGPNDVGKIEDKIYIHTNIEDFEKITVPVLAQVVSPVVFSPKILFLGEIRPGEVLEQTVVAWSPDSVPFRITGIDTADTGLQTTYLEDETNNTDITFTGTIGDPNKIAEGEIKVLVELLESQKSLSIKLPIYASIRTNKK